jgi:hypothetical protein
MVRLAIQNKQRPSCHSKAPAREIERFLATGNVDLSQAFSGEIAVMKKPRDCEILHDQLLKSESKSFQVRSNSSTPTGSLGPN